MTETAEDLGPPASSTKAEVQPTARGDVVPVTPVARGGEIPQQIVHEPLTATTIRQRLNLATDLVVVEILVVARERLATEWNRHTALDEKAAALLGQSAVVSTIATAVGGTLIQMGAIKDVFGVWLWPVSGSYVAAIVAGLFSAGLAIAASKVRAANVGVSESAIFDETVISMSSKEVGDDNPNGGPTAYKRFLANHLWQIGSAHHNANEKKANDLENAQKFFIGFLALVALAGLLSTVAIYCKQEPQMTSASPTTSPASPKTEPAPAATSAGARNEAPAVQELQPPIALPLAPAGKALKLNVSPAEIQLPAAPLEGK